MIGSPLLRLFRYSPIKILVACIVVLLYVSLPQTDPHPRLDTSSDSSDTLAAYDELRLQLLRAKGFNSTLQADRLLSPQRFPNGKHTFDPSIDAYVDRLRHFVGEYFIHSPTPFRKALLASLNRAGRHVQPTPPVLPAKVWSTDRLGAKGVAPVFGLWSKLLPLPLSTSLFRLDTLADAPDYLLPAQGGEWDTYIPDDDGMDQMMSVWTGESVSRGNVSGGKRGEKFGALWGKLSFGVLRADLYRWVLDVGAGRAEQVRYVTLLLEGGIYSDSDTAPIAHPYLWGAQARDILHPTLALLLSHMSQKTATLPPDRLNPRESLATHPLAKRLPTTRTFSTSSILTPDISIVIAIEWDDTIGFRLSRWDQWAVWRWRRWKKSCTGCGGRSLQISQYTMMAKPFHPIMLDTIATIAELVESDSSLGALDLSGPGPFTDAVFRYLLVQYGVTPADLRNTRGPVRIGDVVILQEEGFNAPEKAFDRLVSAVAWKNTKDPWVWGQGFSNWRSGGIQVVHHGNAGRWKGQGWN
ncbi:hypothetical protein P7C73_g2322, partial [Tremellales sp. Uapishka_1]